MTTIDTADLFTPASRRVPVNDTPTCGASAMAEFNYLQHIQRDVNTVSLHGLLRASVCLEVYGATLCGLEPTTMPLV